MKYLSSIILYFDEDLFNELSKYGRSVCKDFPNLRYITTTTETFQILYLFTLYNYEAFVLRKSNCCYLF